MASGNPIIGLDFDNTLVCYDSLFHQVALERGLIGATVAKVKREVRQAVRLLPGGEIEWQKLQGFVYGPRMQDAVLAEGVCEFFQACTQRGAKLYIVSHKTEFANYDETRTNLRRSAMDWMINHKFFDTAGLSLAPEDIFMVPTRGEKLDRIAALGCTHFVDDLEEVFMEESFPPGVKKILLASESSVPPLPGVQTVSSWKQIADSLFQ